MSELTDDQILATHEMSQMSGSCHRCGFTYAVIISDRLECGKGPRRRKGRPRGATSLEPTEEGERYGWIRFVTTPELRNRAIEHAKAHQTSLSEIVRRALTAYVDGKGAVRGWDEADVRDAIYRLAKKWIQQPVELEGDVMLVFGMTPRMVDDLVTEMYRQGRRISRPREEPDGKSETTGSDVEAPPN